MEYLSAQLAFPAQAIIGEGPRWDELNNELVWVDILGRKVHRLGKDNASRSTIEVPSDVGVAEIKSDGSYILAVRDGFASVDADGTNYQLIFKFPEGNDPQVRMNDGACDAMGRFWAGTMHDSKANAGSLYCMETDGSVSTKISQVSISNGIGWNHANNRMYFIDSPTREIQIFDFDLQTGHISNPRCFVKIDKQFGLPDGLAIDAEDCLWVTLYGGGAVHRYSPSGELLAVVNVPVPNTTSCTFGGKDLSTLYITTARAELSQNQLDEYPLSGSVFAVDVDAKGNVAYRYGDG